MAEFISSLLYSILGIRGARDTWRERNSILALLPLRFWVIAVIVIAALIASAILRAL
jgi:hypothetical protein